MTAKLKALDKYIKARDDLKSQAHRQFTKRECPLNLDDYGIQHSKLSQALWGTGQWKWDCEFCGEEFEE